MPLLTVLMPTYNAMPYLPEAVRSVLGQTLRDFTFLIIDDGSTDGSGEYLEQLADRRVRVVRAARRGLGAVLNHGVGLCETEFLSRMDADDLSLPPRFDRQWAFLQQHPEVGMVGSQFGYFGGERRLLPSPSLPCDHDEIVEQTLKGNLAIVHGTLMFRTSVLRAAGGYRLAGMGEDWDMFLRMGEAARLANLGEILYLYRLHRDNCDLNRFVDLQIGIEYACHCAAVRRIGEREPTPEEFRQRQRTRPRLVKLLKLIDAYALTQYRLALVDVAERRMLGGYARLLYSAICAPARTLARFGRILRHWR